MSAPIRKSLRILALFGMGLLIGFWISRGSHTGWSMDRVPVQQTDEITGLEFTTYEDRYIPGLEVLGGGLTLGVVILGLTFLPVKKST